MFEKRQTRENDENTGNEILRMRRMIAIYVCNCESGPHLYLRVFRP